MHRWRNYLLLKTPGNTRHHFIQRSKHGDTCRQVHLAGACGNLLFNAHRFNRAAFHFAAPNGLCVFGNFLLGSWLFEDAGYAAATGGNLAFHDPRAGWQRVRIVSACQQISGSYRHAMPCQQFFTVMFQ